MAKERVEANSCPAWCDGFCMVDGTLIPLFEKPGHHREAYFDQKSNYSMNFQVSTSALIRQQHRYSHRYHQAHLYPHPHGYLPSKPWVYYDGLVWVSVGTGITSGTGQTKERLIGRLCWGTRNTFYSTTASHIMSYQEC